MRSFRCHTLRRTFRLRLTTSLALFVYLTATVGFPLPAPTIRDHRQRYPCENHPCGCRSAEECWRHCCCFTPEQRWAWASANGVEPPAYAERPGLEGLPTAQLRSKAEEETCQVCSHKCKDKENASATWPKARCACQREGASCCEAEPPTPAKDSKRKPVASLRWAVGVTALQCRGVSTLWLSSSGVVPPPPVAVWRPYSIPLGWVLFPNSYLFPVSLPPPDPPPRQLSV
jgi:hypothetical protein